MMRRKKKDPNAPPPPPRDNGLPPRPPELAEAQKALQATLGAAANVVPGFGFSSSDPPPKSGARSSDPQRTACWRLFVFTDDAALQLPSSHGGFPVERRGVPRPTAWPSRHR